MVKLLAYSVIIKCTSGFTSNTLLIRFPIMLSVYIVYRMHKVERRMVKTMYVTELQSALREITRGSIMCCYLMINDLVSDRMK